MNLPFLLIGIVVLLAVYLWSTYNSLVVLKTRIKEALSGIDVQLKRRIDLIPNLVETVKGYAKHEKSVFENVTKARSSLMKADSMSGKAEANNMLTDALKSLFAVAEAYPKLMASDNFKMLQEELSGTESKIAYSRQFYNDNVLSLNQKVQQFPTNILANMFKITEKEYFKVEESDKKPVKVKFE